MSLKVKAFNQEGKEVWSNKDNTAFSAGIQGEDSRFNPETGWEHTEKFMYWVKSRTEENVIPLRDVQIKNIEEGKLVFARLFSETPFYPTQKEDFNKDKGVFMGRYSKTILCTPERKEAIHRTFVTLDPTIVADEVEVPVQVEA